MPVPATAGSKLAARLKVAAPAPTPYVVSKVRGRLRWLSIRRCVSRVRGGGSSRRQAPGGSTLEGFQPGGAVAGLLLVQGLLCRDRWRQGRSVHPRRARPRGGREQQGGRSRLEGPHALIGSDVQPPEWRDVTTLVVVAGVVPNLVWMRISKRTGYKFADFCLDYSTLRPIQALFEAEDQFVAWELAQGLRGGGCDHRVPRRQFRRQLWTPCAVRLR
jgi:hypothetical protein